MANRKPALRLKQGEVMPPPHPLHGFYKDSTSGNMYWVPNLPKFVLYRLTEKWEADIDSPTQDDPEHFQKLLNFNTFTRINH